MLSRMMLNLFERDALSRADPATGTVLPPSSVDFLGYRIDHDDDDDDVEFRHETSEDSSGAQTRGTISVPVSDQGKTADEVMVEDSEKRSIEGKPRSLCPRRGFAFRAIAPGSDARRSSSATNAQIAPQKLEPEPEAPLVSMYC